MDADFEDAYYLDFELKLLFSQYAAEPSGQARYVDACAGTPDEAVEVMMKGLDKAVKG